MYVHILRAEATWLEENATWSPEMKRWLCNICRNVIYATEPMETAFRSKVEPDGPIRPVTLTHVACTTCNPKAKPPKIVSVLSEDELALWKEPFEISEPKW